MSAARTVLVDRYEDTESAGSSMHDLMTQIETGLTSRYDVLRVPTFERWSDRGLESWMRDHAANAAVGVLASDRSVRALRAADWRGPVLFNVLGGLPHGATALRQVVPQLTATDRIWCACEADLRCMREYVADADRVAATFPYAIAAEGFVRYDPSERAEARRSLGLVDEIVLVYAGRFTPDKNLQLMIEVAAQLGRDGVPAKLLLVGDYHAEPSRMLGRYADTFQADLKSIADRLDASQRVRYLPWVDHGALNVILNASDIFLFPSTYVGENFGMSMHQAMAVGLPVVAAAWSSAPECVEDMDNGILAGTWLTDGGVRVDAPAFYAAVLRLARDSRLRSDIGERGVAHAQNSCTTARMTESLLAVLDAMLRRPVIDADPLRLTPWAEQLAVRFTDPLTGTEVAPEFASTSDRDFQRMLGSFISRSGTPGAEGYFKALYGEVTADGYFQSADPANPGRHRLSEAESKVLTSVRRLEPTRLTGHDPSDVERLIARGLIGRTVRGGTE